MKLVFKFTKSDVIAFSMYHLANSTAQKKSSRRFQIAFLIVFLGLSLTNFISKDFLEAVIFVFIGVLLFIFYPDLINIANKSHVRRHCEEMSGVLFDEPESLELRDDGLHEVNAIGHGVYKYAALGKIVEDCIRTYFYIGNNTAIVLPEDRVARDQIDAFVAEVRSRVESAKASLGSSD